MTTPLIGCLAVVLGLGLVERLARDRAWRAVPIRIHVNGTRGKSTVTRLIWSALREAGIPAIAKTTGTEARLLFPDGSERPLVRRSPPSIREQLRLLRLARRARARAAVVECMALHPELQSISEHQMVRATIGVITNVRLDHAEIMGREIAEVAGTLANTIPRSATLVVGDDRFLALFRARAAGLGTRVVSSSAAASDLAGPGLSPRTEVPGWLAEDTAVALTVTRELEIADAVALRGFARAPADPGAVRQGTCRLQGGAFTWIDATAANDPTSLAALVGNDRLQHGGVPDREVVVYNHRDDRDTRLDGFARASDVVARADRLVLTGSRPPWILWGALRRTRGRRATEYVRPRHLARRLGGQVTGARVIFCGNTRGLDVVRVIEEIEARG